LQIILQLKLDQGNVVYELNIIHTELRETQRCIHPDIPIYGTILPKIRNEIASYFLKKKEEVKKIESRFDAERRLKTLREKAFILVDELKNIAKSHVDDADIFIEDKLNMNFELNFNQSFQAGNYQEVVKIMRRTKSDPKVFQRFKTKVAEKVNQFCFERIFNQLK
jgi:hypothetical protein